MKLTKWMMLAVLLLYGGWTRAQQSSKEVLDLIVKVNDYWQEHNTPYCRAFWDNAAYFTGNMEAYKMTGKAEYYQYSDKWCRHNQWKGAKSNDKKNWKYAWYGGR